MWDCKKCNTSPQKWIIITLLHKVTVSLKTQKIFFYTRIQALLVQDDANCPKKFF